jgi:hypothetical protein
VALAVGAILLGANVTTELLKPLLAEPRPGYLPSLATPALPGSWPSGHATAAMSLVLCCVLAAPARLRPLIAALGAMFAVAVCYAFLSLEWHYPTDVLGGFLVAAIWTLLGIAAVLTADERRRAAGKPAVADPPTDELGVLSRRPTIREALGPPSTALLAAIALALLVLIARPQQVVAYASVHKTFVVGAAVIGGLGMALATGVMLALRR